MDKRRQIFEVNYLLTAVFLSAVEKVAVYEIKSVKTHITAPTQYVRAI